MKKQQKNIGVSPEIREALAEIAGSKYFPRFIQFLKNEMNNIAVEEWFRLKPLDKDLNVKKAFFEGRFEEIKAIIRTFEESKKEEEK